MVINARASALGQRPTLVLVSHVFARVYLRRLSRSPSLVPFFFSPCTDFFLNLEADFQALRTKRTSRYQVVFLVLFCLLSFEELFSSFPFFFWTLK